MGFVSLQHIRNRRSTVRGFCLPATFRLQGLATLVAVSSLRFRAGFVSHRRRSWDSPFGAFSSRKVSACSHGDGPTYRFADENSHRRSGGRPRRPRFLGFDPSGNPWRPSVCLARQTLDAPLGFALRGFAREGLDRDSARSPLPHFIVAPGFHVGKPRPRPAPQSIDRLSPRPALFLARWARDQAGDP
jgi:hypothetical protein